MSERAPSAHFFFVLYFGLVIARYSQGQSTSEPTKDQHESIKAVRTNVEQVEIRRVVLLRRPLLPLSLPLFQFVSSLISDVSHIIGHSLNVESKINALNQVWPHAIRDFIRQVILEYRDGNRYLRELLNVTFLQDFSLVLCSRAHVAFCFFF